MKKVTYIVSKIDKALAFEWIATYINKKRFDIEFILINPGDSHLEAFLKQQGIPVKRVTYRGKKDLIKAILTTYFHLIKRKPDSIHAHLFEASLIGLTASWLARVPKRIYTRHHADFHYIYYPHAVKYDKYINALATDIIAISQVVKDVLLKEKAPEYKIQTIHHGFDLEKFMNVPDVAIKKLQEKYNPLHTHPVIGVISRYIEVKGVQYIIPAFKKFIEKYPDALLILANAKGDYQPVIKQLLETIPKRNYIEIQFETDIFALYKLFDFFIHVPLYKEFESFGQIYVEALSSRIASVFTLSGIANEFIQDHKNALVVPYRDSIAIYNAILELQENDHLKSMLQENGQKDVISRFGLTKMIAALEDLYDK